MAGYDTEQMLYMDKPYALSSFAHSAWISSPANMLYPLIIQSLEHSHYFFAIASGPDADKTDYRLDTQVIALQQNFLKRPSMLQLSIKVVLTHIQDNRIVASRLMTQDIACSEDTPYGGVVAANHAAYAFTDRLAKFVVHATQTDQITIK
jgi:cholesterol transport system auxiliary component